MHKQDFISVCFRRLFSLILLAGVLSGAFQIVAQVKRGTAAKKPTVAKPGDVSEKEEKLDLEKLIPPDKGRMMGAAFKDGILPAPAALPAAENVERQASMLAEMVAAGDENSTAALMTAYKVAGYGLRDAGGSISFNQESWQGITLSGWEIAAVSKLYGEGYGVGLGRFGDGLSLLAPEWKKETNVQNIIEGIRNAASNPNQSVRFWANFIIALGQHAQTPFDLRNDEDIKRARLDAVQISMILTRLAADGSFVARQSQPPAQAKQNEPNRGYFANASFRNGYNGQRANFTRINSSYDKQGIFLKETQQEPCALGDLENLVSDINATGTGYVFNKMFAHLEQNKGVAKAPGQIIGAANAALILLKLMMTYAALNAEVSMDGDFLTRTKTTVDGDRKSLTAKVKMDVGKWQIMNCIRPMLNASGIDFSLPTNGALSNVRIDWNLLEGGETRENIRRIKAGQTSGSDAIVYLDTLATAKAEDSKKYYNYTDSNGESKIYAVGAKQKTDLSKLSLSPVAKTMAVNLDIQVKTMKIKDATGAVGTANDLAGNTLTFLSGDLPGFIAGTAAETIYRSNFGSSKVHVFPVKDWIPCDGGWHGTITYKRIDFNLANSAQTKNGKRRSFEIDIDRDLYTARINVSPGANPNLFKASAVMNYERNAYRYKKMEEDNYACRGWRGTWARKTLTQIKSVADGVDNDVHATFSSNGKTASIGFQLFQIKGGNNAHYEDIFFHGCEGENKPQISDKKDEITIAGGNFSIDNIPIDPNNPNLLRGSRTINGDGGRETTISWNLSRCK